jgi:hypothetical protein
MFGGADGIFLHCLFFYLPFVGISILLVDFVGDRCLSPICLGNGKLPSRVLVCKSAPLAMNYTTCMILAT